MYFVHSAFRLFEKLPSDRRRCRFYIEKLFAVINAALSSNLDTCRTLANIMLKAYVLDNSDKERELGCLRRKEKVVGKQLTLFPLDY